MITAKTATDPAVANHADRVTEQMRPAVIMAAGRGFLQYTHQMTNAAMHRSAKKGGETIVADSLRPVKESAKNRPSRTSSGVKTGATEE